MPLPTLDTSRLRLRPLSITDGEEIRRLAGDYEIASTTLLVPHPYPEGVAERWIATHEEAFDRGEQLNLGIFERRSDALIGAMGLVLNAAHRRADLGYWIGKPSWGQGYCTEAGRAVVAYGFETLGLHRIQATHFCRNPASGRVLRKIGLRHEATLRGYCLKWGVFEDTELYAMLTHDWREMAAHCKSPALP